MSKAMHSGDGACSCWRLLCGPGVRSCRRALAVATRPAVGGAVGRMRQVAICAARSLLSAAALWLFFLAAAIEARPRESLAGRERWGLARRSALLLANGAMPPEEAALMPAAPPHTDPDAAFEGLAGESYYEEFAEHLLASCAGSLCSAGKRVLWLLLLYVLCTEAIWLPSGRHMQLPDEAARDAI